MVSRLRAALCTAPAVALALSGCMQVSTGPTDPAASAAADAGASSQEAGPHGTGCGTDQVTGVILCSGVDTCPGLGVDPSAWNGCGFRGTGGSTLDLECVCGGALCPIGVAATCDQASQLLTSQNLLAVCQQVSEGRCVALTTGTTGSSGGVKLTCNQGCLVGCGTAPDCLQICGC